MENSIITPFVKRGGHANMKKVFAVLLSLGILSALQLDIMNRVPMEFSGVQAASSNEATQHQSKLKSALANMTGTYDNARPGRAYGKPLPKSDLTIAGVSLGADFSDIQRSLGTPSATTWYGNQIDSLTYGGITFSTFQRSEKMFYIEIVNRDAVTNRGVAVGDSLEKVYALYGRPDAVNEGHNMWFYGVFYPLSDNMQGIRFVHDGNRVTKIIIW